MITANKTESDNYHEAVFLLCTIGFPSDFTEEGNIQIDRIIRYLSTQIKRLEDENANQF